MKAIAKTRPAPGAEPGAGHWIQQERPGEVNRLMIDFLRSVQG